MKRTLFMIMALLGLLFYGCSEDLAEPAQGSIAGSVADRTTGEPVATVNVTLSPGGMSTITGSDGTFTYTNLEPGSYQIAISKEGYKSNIEQFSVAAGGPTSAHMLIERIPASIVADRDVLDFGDNKSVTTLSFTIVNSGYSDLAFKVEKGDCSWITVDPEADILAYGKTATIVVKIDREKLASGKNEAVIVVRSTSGNGNVEVKVIAVGEYKATSAVNTLEVTDVTNTSVTLNGEITNVGAPAYTERGFVYDTEELPTVDRNRAQLTAPITQQARYSCHAENLSPTQIYYARAYCIQNGKVIYGNSITFTTSKQSVNITTSAVTNIDATTATLNASISDAGTPAYTERGFCYSNLGEPKISDNRKRVSGTGTGSYSLQITGLEYPVTYYVRAYAIQDGSPVYGNTVSFSTIHGAPSLSTSAATTIGATTATLNASISNAGSPAYTERGFCYNQSGNPTISHNRQQVTGGGVGSYSLQISGLECRETYYARAYVIQSGTPIYGNVISFSTIFESAVVNTLSVEDIEKNTAEFNGRITNVGQPGYTESGFCYSSTTSTPTIYNEKVSNLCYTPIGGAYREKITGLQEGTTYYVRAFVMQDGEPVYGNTVEFTTTSDPVVITKAVSSKSKYSVIAGYLDEWQVQFNATVTDVGIPAYSKRGFIYNGYGGEKTVSVSGSGAGNFSATVTGLTDNWTYTVRAYVKVGNKTYYGETIQFTTR